MFDRVITNWKSSLCGVVGSLFNMFAATDAGFTWQGLKVALPPLLIGLLFKDK